MQRRIELLGEGQVSISYFYFDLYVFGLMLAPLSFGFKSEFPPRENHEKRS